MKLKIYKLCGNTLSNATIYIIGQEWNLRMMILKYLPNNHKFL